MSFTNYEFPNVSNYDSDLREILHAYKELYNNYNAIFAEFKAIESQFEEFKRVIERLPEDVKKEVTAQLTPLWEELLFNLELRFKGMQNEIDNLTKLVESFQKLVYDVRDDSFQYTDSKSEEMLALLLKYRSEIYVAIGEIKTEIGELQWKLPKIYDITKGVYNPIVAVIYNVYDALRLHALTCGEYDALNLTCREYDDKQLACIEYDVQGKWKLLGHEEKSIYNPYTGLRASVQKVLNYMALYHIVPNNLTCGEYDTLELTCAEYDAHEISCYNYDFFAKNFLVPTGI